MRYPLILLILGCIIFRHVPAIGVEQASKEKFPFTGKINAYDVNLRTGASLNYEIITVMNKGEMLLVERERLDWYGVRYPAGILCWVSRDLVDAKGFVKRSRVNVRSGPGLKHKVMAQVDRDDRVKIVKTSPDGKWAGIVPPPGAGLWVYKKYVDRAGPPELYRNYLAQKKRAQDLLIEADSYRDASLKLSYHEINFEQIRDKYRHIIDKYPEFRQSKIAAGRIEDLEAVHERMLEQVRLKLKAEQQMRQKKQAEWEQMKKKLKYKSYRGIVRQAPASMHEQATHLLTRGNEKVCYLRSDVIKLDDYLYRGIKVWGYVLPERIHRIRLIVVDKIKIVD